MAKSLYNERINNESGAGKMTNVTGWIGTVSGIIGSILVAMNNGLQDFGYIFFLIGSLSWLFVSIKDKANAAIMQWGFFTVINFVGLLSYLK
jgi:nicotinamide riboside transporter PnuC